jgi:hypothetical protein
MFVEEKRQGEVAVPLEPWRQVLLDAADSIERLGWIQHALGTGSGPRCVLGAIHFAGAERGSGWLWTGTIDAVTKMHAALGRNNLPVWNDAPGRTKDEVLALLRRVATAHN